MKKSEKSQFQQLDWTLIVEFKVELNGCLYRALNSPALVQICRKETTIIWNNTGNGEKAYNVGPY